MKKSTKALLIAAFCCVLVGLSFCIASFFFGISERGMTDVVQQGRVQLEEKLGWFRDIGTDLSKSEKTETEFSETYANITELDLDLDETNCVLIPWQEAEWKVSGSRLPTGFSCSQDGTKLKIRSKKSTWNFWKFGNETSVLEIYVPERELLEEVKIDLGTGELTVQEGFIRSEKLEVDCGVGNCSLRMDIRKEMKIDCGVGEVDATLLGKSTDFDYNLQCGVGEVMIDGESYGSIGAETKVSHDASKEIRIDCGVGSVSVEFEEDAQ